MNRILLTIFLCIVDCKNMKDLDNIKVGNERFKVRNLSE